MVDDSASTRCARTLHSLTSKAFSAEAIQPLSASLDLECAIAALRMALPSSAVNLLMGFHPSLLFGHTGLRYAGKLPVDTEKCL